MAILDSAEKEQKLIIDAIRSDENSEMLATLFQHIKESGEWFFEDEFSQGIISHNESNIRRIIQILKESEMDREWSDTSIFTDAFREICSIPIFLPITFMGLLSGEFVVYLLHGDEVQMYHPDKSNLMRSEFITEAEYKEAVRRNIYDIKYHRFYRGNSSYVRQMQKAFSIDISPISNTKDKIYSDFVERKNTKLWRLFETYSYLQEEKIFDGNERVKVFLAFSKEYVDIFPMRIDRGLNANQKNMLLLKTFLFQELNEDSRAELNMYIEVKKSIITLGKIVNDIRYALFLMEHLINISEAEQSKRYETGLTFSIEHLQKICTDNKAQITEYADDKNSSKCRIVINENELYPKLLSTIIMYEMLRDLEIREQAFHVKFEDKTSLKDAEFYLDLHKPDFRISLNWTQFFSSQKYLLEQLLGKKEEKQYKKIWLIAIKVLMFCYPERLNFDNSIDNVPKSLDETWLKNNHITLDNIRPIELYSMMKLVDKSNHESVITEGKSSKIYRMIKDKQNISSTRTSTPLTLFSILDNIRTHNSPELRAHIVQLLVETNDLWIGQRRSIDCIRDIYRTIISGVRCIAQYTSSLPDAISGVSKLVEYWNKTASHMYEAMNLEYQQRLSWMETLTYLMSNEK